MKKLLILSLLVSISLFSACSSVPKPDIKPPTRIPSEISEKENIMIEEGIRLHDEGLYQDAIDQYAEILAINPDNYVAIGETALTYLRMGNSNAAFDYMFRSLEYDSVDQSPVYIMLGSMYDDLGYPEYALEVYEKGIEITPHYLIYFNLGVTHFRLGNTEAAEEAFFADLKENPYHSSANFQLSNMYTMTNQRFPGIFAALMCLAHEPNSERSYIALNNLFDNILSGVQVEQKERKTIKIFIDKDAPAEYMMMGLLLGSEIGNEDFEEDMKNKDYVGMLTKALEKIFICIKVEKDNFLHNYYFSFFKELHEKEFKEVFVRYILQGQDEPEVNEWLANNFADVSKFEDWLKEYQFKSNKHKD